jgi:Bacteriocin-protection, YdeI or OmpD-Associated/Domain of unknown function (DUF1905)
MDPEPPMSPPAAHPFEAELEIIGINPFVSAPEPILEAIFEAVGKRTGPIPICGTLAGAPYRQSLVRYRGAWRLYVNTTMLKDSPRRVGERLTLTVAHDPIGRAPPASPAFERALAEHPAAKATFDALAPSRQREIVRYIASLKSPASIARNVARAIAFLTGDGRFIGSDRP